MRLLDLVTIEEIIRSTDGTDPREGIGKESCDDLRPLCRALFKTALQRALHEAREGGRTAGIPGRIWLLARRLALRTKWGARRAAKDVPVMMARKASSSRLRSERGREHRGRKDGSAYGDCA